MNTTPPTSVPGRPGRVNADALEVTPRNITGLVDGLVASGHVSREPHPTDRRATLVTLTAVGTGTVTEMQSSHGRLADDLFGEMGERRLASLVSALDETIERFARLMAGRADPVAVHLRLGPRSGGDRPGRAPPRVERRQDSAAGPRHLVADVDTRPAGGHSDPGRTSSATPSCGRAPGCGPRSPYPWLRCPARRVVSTSSPAA